MLELMYKANSTLKVLFWCDGTIDLYGISKKLNVDINLIYKEAKKLEKKKIIEHE